MVSHGWLRQHPFLSSNMLQQAHFNHDAILLDALGRKPMDSTKDLRLSFQFETCWAKDKEAKDVICEA